MNYKCHKIKFKRGPSYIDSPDSIKNEKAIINYINSKGSNTFNKLKQSP